ncbi:MAG: peptidylprolyl isomerase [Bacteroidales bacterium]|jgi:peptidyl-prolyl cis-trans isomerase SurA|nr:peptidylprolyl isomerase [Bacteroidales bacterium]
MKIMLFRLKHITGSVLLLLCACVFTAQAQSYVIDQIVAIVGSKPVKLSDVENRYLQMRMQGMPVRGDMKCSIFEQILTEKLLVNQAEVDSLIVEASKVEAELNIRWAEMVGSASDKDIEEHFKKSVYEIKEDFRENLHEQLLAQEMQRKILEDLKVTPSEVQSFFNKLHKDSIPLINGQAEVAQIFIYPPYSDEAISEVRQKLLDLRRRVLSGENFRTLAVLYSEDPTAARLGGEVGFKSKGELDPEYVKAAWALKNKGDVSRIVESKFGYHIIQLVDKRGDQVNTRHILMTPKPNPEAVEKSITRLDSIAQIIKDGKIDWNTAALYFSQDENTRFNGGLMINPDDHSTLFEMDKLVRMDYAVVRDLKVGEISLPFASVDGKNKTVYKIVKIKSLSDPHRANLKTDYAFLQDITRQQKTLSVINKWVNEKIETSYIYVDERFKNCGLNNINWLK